jgi:hypothetical protein
MEAGGFHSYKIAYSSKLSFGVSLQCVLRFSTNTYDVPESRLSLTTTYGIEGKEFHIFLSSFFQGRAIRQHGATKPGLVPPSRDDGMAKIAQSLTFSWTSGPPCARGVMWCA